MANSGSKKRKDRPTVFVSSTIEDLKLYRAAARDAALSAEFFPVLSEYLPAKDTLPVKECLARVSGSDLVVAIVAHKYGFEPPDQDAKKVNDKKSITWLECECAASGGKDLLVFVVDESWSKDHWPAEFREEHRMTEALRGGKATQKLLAEVQHGIGRLDDFKQWLTEVRWRKTFTTSEDLRGLVSDALREWRDRHPQFAASATEAPSRPLDPAKYLEALREATAYIDIRGLQVASGKAHRFPIEDLFIPLTTVLAAEEPAGASRARRGHREKQGRRLPLGEKAELGHQQAVDLGQALRETKLTIIGDPGSGKSTFLRRIAHALCETLSGLDPAAAQTRLGLADNPLPILIAIRELAEHVRNCRARQSNAVPTTAHSADWLLHFLAARSAESNWGLDESFFRERMLGGECLILIDGLDEGATREEREELAAVVESAVSAYSGCRFVVTSRPQSYRGKAALPGFQQVEIQPLDDDAIETFLGKWSEGLFLESPAQAKTHRDALMLALRARQEIRRLARNPVMLTALAVVHWNEKRLPEQRADLYESIINWLSRSREQRPGRAPAERCVSLLQQLALAMQDDPAGRRVQVAKGWAAEKVAPALREVPEAQQYERAGLFLTEEEEDSGIIVSRGNELRFWHLTFQEYLAARALAGLSEREQQETLFTPGDKIYRPEWREAVLLLGGVLHAQGVNKVDGLVAAILDAVGQNPELRDQARCVGLLGAVLKDLAPLHYHTADPPYEAMLQAVQAIFDPRQGGKIDLNIRIEAADALGQAGDPRLGKDNPENWVPIEGDSFWMGAQSAKPGQRHYDPEAGENEAPIRQVKLGPYLIGRYPVTVQEYEAFIEEGGYEERRWWLDGGFGDFQAPEDWEEQLDRRNSPVTGVSWYEAAAYCAWVGGRLLTEEEWEFAARGRVGRKYPWGPDEPNPEVANYVSEGQRPGRVTPVGLYPGGATPEGVYDMAGNVWEWVATPYAPYGGVKGVERSSGDRSAVRVVRGGSFSYAAGFLRAAYRVGVVPQYRLVNLGFRCAREVFP